MKRIPTFVLLLFILVSSILAGCSSNDGAAQGVLSYFQALASKDANQLSQSSCSSWESQALTELESFGAVEVNLQDPACKNAGEEGDYILVSCTGKIVANYGNEVLEINLADRMYLVADEGGDWRMCGYR